FATFQVRDRALHLHTHELSRTPHHTIKTVRVPPRFAHRQALLGGAFHENRFGPLPAQFLVLDDLCFPLLHSLTPDWKSGIPGNLANTALCFYSIGMKSQRQEK